MLLYWVFPVSSVTRISASTVPATTRDKTALTSSALVPARTASTSPVSPLPQGTDSEAAHGLQQTVALHDPVPLRRQGFDLLLDQNALGIQHFS